MIIIAILLVNVGGIYTYYARYNNGEQKEITKHKADLIQKEWDKKK